MMIPFDVYPILLLLLAGSAFTGFVRGHDTTSDACGVYFAPSSIPGAGWGMFAGRDFQSFETITPGDIVVPLIDYYFHNGGVHGESQNLWVEYMWGPDGFEGFYEEAEQVYGVSFGIGAMPNCFFAQNNAEKSDTRYDTAGLHRSKDPGVGAFSPYHQLEGYANQPIYAGQEIFLDYGEAYFDDRVEEIGVVPRSIDYTRADRFLKRFQNLTTAIDGCHFRRKDCPLDKKQKLALDSALRDVFNIVRAIDRTWKSYTFKALPKSFDQLDDALSAGTAQVQSRERRHALEWLQTNGVCMDNIRPGISTLEQAGRGAFAARRLEQGQIIAPVPLIHIPDRACLNIYSSYMDSTFRLRDGIYSPHYSRNVTSPPFHQQLAINYCFGHRDTTLLLCPYGAGTGLINHSSKHPNAKLQWSERLSRKLDWLEQSPEKWTYILTSGLAFELIATRPIEPGEEILINYGEEWENAWERHVASWQPPRGSEKYVSGMELEQNRDLPIRTMFEEPYNSDYISQECRTWYGVEEKYASELTPCRVVVRNLKGTEYTYVLELFIHVIDDEECEEVLQDVVWEADRDAIYFEDVLYSRDHAQPWSFRHYMQIPDEMLPLAWKNVQ